MRSLAALSRALAILAFLVIGAGAARAQSCAASFTSISFGGGIDILPGAAIDSAGSLSISCSGFGGGAARKVVVCVGLGNGVNSSGAPRAMASGANRLAYDLYTDSARTTRWTATTNTEPSYVFTSAAPSLTIPIYARIVAGQRSSSVGFYADTVTPAIAMRVYLGAAKPSCPTVTMLVTAAAFQVSGTIVPNCGVSATNMTFPTTSSFQSNIDANSSVFVTCTTNAPYWIALDGGNAKAPPTARRMSLGASTIAYGLYQDAARVVPWGQTQFKDTVAGTGAATAATIPVYGRIPPQASPPPGTYTDLVTVTVNF